MSRNKVDNNYFAFDDQTTYRRIQTIAGVPLALNPAGSAVVINGSSSIKSNSLSVVGQNIAQNGSTVITNMDNPLYFQTDSAQDIIFRPNINEKFRVGTSNLTVADGVGIILGSTNGTKIGTATTQKLGHSLCCFASLPADVWMSWASRISRR